MTKELFDHPLLYSLFAGNDDPQKLTGFLVRGVKENAPQRDGAPIPEAGKRLPFMSDWPSDIPSRNFALALLDIVGGSGSDGGALTIELVKAKTLALPEGRVRQALLTAIGEAGNDIDRARMSLEAWFDGTMDRVSGWYKRENSAYPSGLGLAHRRAAQRRYPGHRARSHHQQYAAPNPDRAS